MKQILLLILAIVSINVSMAQPKDVKKIINKYDIRNYTKGISQRNPALFWMAVEDNNPRAQKLRKALEKREKTIMEVCEGLLQVVDYMQKYDAVVPGCDSLTYLLENDLGITKTTKNFPIRIIADNTFNASMDPIGQMRINVGILPHLSYQELLAVCAHEVAHFYCDHVVDRVYKDEKKRKKNRMWADIGASLVVGAAAASGAYAGGQGVDISGNTQLIENSGIFFQAFRNEADQASLRYFFRYSREEELEADIIAYRFMEFMGYGTEHWISAMRKMLNLSGDFSVKAGKHDDHPTTMFRLQVLTAMQSGYEGK